MSKITRVLGGFKTCIAVMVHGYIARGERLDGGFINIGGRVYIKIMWQGLSISPATIHLLR